MKLNYLLQASVLALGLNSPSYSEAHPNVTVNKRVTIEKRVNHEYHPRPRIVIERIIIDDYSHVHPRVTRSVEVDINRKASVHRQYPNSTIDTKVEVHKRIRINREIDP